MVVAVEEIAINMGECVVNCTVKRSKKRRRTLALMMHPQEGIVAHIPWRTTAEYFQEFLHGHRRWILARVQQLNALPKHTLNTGEQVSYLGQICNLKVTESPKRSQCVYEEAAGQLHITIKPQEDEAQRQKAVYLQLKKWYYAQAHPFLSERLAFWQEKMQLSYGELRISNPKRQWGCCHANNNISINWRVMMTSLELIDYLLVHELCHTVHKNHSAKFWNLVGTAIPDYRERRRDLQKHDAGYFGML
jgi:predicted metal-dependent hydrolase